MSNLNPAFGAHLEPLHGIPSFMRLPVSRDLKDVDIASLLVSLLTVAPASAVVPASGRAPFGRLR